MQKDVNAKSDIDIAIIGGGISALGTAIALTNRGYSVALFEKGAIGQATSANSLRIIHGGFRYLQSLNIARSLRSIKDQYTVRTQYSQFVRDLSCVLPLVPKTLRTQTPLMLASLFYTTCYALLTRNVSVRGRVHTENSGSLFQNLPGYGSQGVFVWDDVLLTDPEGLVQQIAREIETSGSLTVSGAELLAGKKDAAGWKLDFAVEGERRTVQASLVINATGPWVQDVAQRLGHSGIFSNIQWSRAINLRLNRLIEKHYGIAFDVNDHSLFFMTPRGDQSIIGTFYDLWTKGADTVEVEAHEIDTLREKLNKSLASLKILPEHVAGYDVGLLPARKVIDGKPVLVGSDEIVKQDGALHILSTKYTTFLSLGELVLRRVEKMLSVKV